MGHLSIFSPISDADNSLIALARTANLTSALPAAPIIIAEIDPLRRERQALAQKLQAVGVSVDYQNYPGVTHEFFGTGAVVSKGLDAVQFAADGLRRAFKLTDRHS